MTARFHLNPVPLALAAVALLCAGGAAWSQPRLRASHSATVPHHAAAHTAPAPAPKHSVGVHTAAARGGRSAAAESSPRVAAAASRRRDSRRAVPVAKVAAESRELRTASPKRSSARTASFRAAVGKRQSAKSQVGSAEARRTDSRGLRAEASQRDAAGNETAVAAAEQPASRFEAVAPGLEKPADRATRERVHAWMEHRAQQNRAVVAAPDATADENEPRSQTAATPDLATSPRKATLQDFDRAAERQRTVQQRTAAQQQRLSTDADDATATASQLPSTAPTERQDAAVRRSTGRSESRGTERSESRGTGRSESRGTERSESRGLKSSAPSAATPAAASGSAPAAMPSGTHPAPLPPAQKPAVPAAHPVLLPGKAPVLESEVVDGLTESTFDAPAPTSPAAATRKALQLTAARAAEPAAVSPTAAAGAVAGTAAAGDAVAAAADKVEDDAEPAVPDSTTVRSGRLARVELPGMFDSRGHLIAVAPMRGSHEILVHQNQMALGDGLDRVDDDRELASMRRQRLLVALPDSAAIGPDERLPLNRRYARPWTVRFLNDLGAAHFARFHTPLIITSAVRTVEFQRHLIRVNGNAAPWTGDVASPHLYGQAIDLGKHGMSAAEIAWMRAYLTAVESEGKIDVEEEFQQACFHISVYRRYLGTPARQKQVEPARDTTLLQAKAAPRRRHSAVALLATRLP